MGMAMTVMSFAMLERCTGVRVQRIQASDLNPIRIWSGVEDRAVRVKDRAVKYYENLKWVYEIETQLRSIEAQQDAQSSAAPAKRSAEDQQEKSDASAPHQGNKKE